MLFSHAKRPEVTLRLPALYIYIYIYTYLYIERCQNAYKLFSHAKRPEVLYDYLHYIYIYMMMICLPPQGTPPQHSSRHGPQHTQHTASTAATPRYPQSIRQYPCRRAGPTQTVYARPFRRAQTQGQRKGTRTIYIHIYIYRGARTPTRSSRPSRCRK